MSNTRWNPLIRMVNATLTSKQIKPLSKKPPRRPSFGTSLHGPILRYFATENANAKGTTKIET